MIYNSTYKNDELDNECEKIVGKKYNIIDSILLNGIGSKRLIVKKYSKNFIEIVEKKIDLIYSNIELREMGIFVYIGTGQKRYSWVIPYYKLVLFKTPNYTIHCDEDFIAFSNEINYKENINFFKKLIDHKIKFDQHNNSV